jgi:glycosyltransferase involved in cell wall biosynthesis
MISGGHSGGVATSDEAITFVEQTDERLVNRTVTQVQEGGSTPLLAVVILAYNEEKHIARCLSSISDFCDEIFVIDSFSTDKTAEVARSHGARVLQNTFVNYAKQFQWALDNAPITADWIIRLDADEIIESDLAQQISDRLKSLPADVVGINLKRKHIFLGRWIRHGGRYPLILLRIWRRGHGRIENRWMDEHMIVWGGRTVTFDGGFADHNLNDLTFFTDKHNRYATREAIDVLNQRYRLFASDTGTNIAGSTWKTAATRMLKEKVYNKLPFQISVLSYFLYRYFIRLGFLDGREGLIYHVLQGFWYRFLVASKVLEYERAIQHLAGREAMKFELSRITGFNLD